MEEFLKLVRRYRRSDSVSIRSVTSMTGGYLLAAIYAWEGGSFREEAVFIVENMYGPNKGQLSIGWTHIMHEQHVEED